MTDRSPLYLLARMPVDVRGHVAGCNDLDIARADGSPVEPGRLHVMIAILDAIDAPQDHVIQLIRWILSTIPPSASPSTS